jgi:RNA polymerase sigma-70 factor, ECF subfamily
MRSHGHDGKVEALYRQHAAALLLFAVSITGDRGRAQDAVQQVFLNVLQCGNLQRIADVKAYLFASVRNTVLNELKTRPRSVELEEDSAWFAPERDYAAEANLRHALRELSDNEREVVVLHVWADLTFAQIGDVLQISANTAASRYRYAFAKLRQALQKKENPCANPR